MSDIAQRMALDIAKEIPSVYAGGRLEQAIDHALQKRLPAHDQEVREQVARDIERKCVGQMMPGAISISARIARGGDES